MRVMVLCPLTAAGVHISADLAAAKDARAGRGATPTSERVGIEPEGRHDRSPRSHDGRGSASGGLPVPWRRLPGPSGAAIRRDGTVARYDIADDRVATIDVDGTPNDLILVGDSVWVAV